ncbi:protein immune deficiency [Spodoptera frugiperda]|uniref:Protein immune deficiency n=1 Tax=Spodoptera frugiperda TaxID=7108 RepID=A0A9R0D6I7_SPOFR|nr:protein immune deficiency [Spodoptera frugiperda]
MSPINLKVSKLLEMFKGLKSDAVPRAPRPSTETAPPPSQSDENNVNGDHDEEQEEEIIIESISDDEVKKEKKSKKKKKTSSSKKPLTDDEEEYTKAQEEKRGSASSVNVQASGTVCYNIVNSRGVRLGNDYYFGPVTTMGPKTDKEKEPEEEPIKKDNNIRLLMEATIRPDHDYMDYISKNLGKSWKNFFRKLGYTEGRIDTAQLDAVHRGYSISEARYKLLFEWVNNEDDATLGQLATLLWREGERSIVKDLSNIYKKSKNK